MNVYLLGQVNTCQGTLQGTTILLEVYDSEEKAVAHVKNTLEWKSDMLHEYICETPGWNRGFMYINKDSMDSASFIITQRELH